MVPIDEEFVKGLVGLGECLNTTALHHDIDILDIRVEPEFGYIHVKGTKVDDTGTKMREVFHATQWRDLGITDLKIAPQGAVAELPLGRVANNSLGGL